MNACFSPLKEDVICYDIETLRNNKKHFPFDVSFTYFPLETNVDCLIGKIWKIIYTSEYFFVHADDNLYQFNTYGQFVRKISALGKGPGEYLTIFDVSVDEISGQIYIYDNSNQKVLIYNMLGEYLGQKNCEEMWYRFEVFNNLYVAHPSNIFGNAPCMLKIIAENDSAVCVGNHLLFEPQDLFLVYTVKNFQKINDGLIFMQHFNDTVYRFKSNTKTFSADYYFDFGSARFPANLLASSAGFDTQSSNYGYLKDVTENSKYLFVTIFYRGKDEKYVIDKSAGNSYSVEEKPQSVNFWPKWGYERDILIDFVRAEELIENQDKVSDEQLKTIISTLHEESNPVIVIIK
jgi:hypothetical protein